MQVFTKFGIENLIELVRMYRKARSRLSARRKNKVLSDAGRSSTHVAVVRCGHNLTPWMIRWFFAAQF